MRLVALAERQEVANNCRRWSGCGALLAASFAGVIRVTTLSLQCLKPIHRLRSGFCLSLSRHYEASVGPGAIVGEMGRKVRIDGFGDRIGRAITPRIRHQQLKIGWVGDIAQFDQDRRHVGRAQHAEARRLDRILVQRRHSVEVADHVTRKLHGKCFGLASGKVDENAGDVGRLALQIDAGDDVRLIFLGGELRGLVSEALFESV